MIQPKLTFDGRNVVRGFGRIARDSGKVISQELNAQRRAFRGGTGKGRGGRTARVPVVGLTRRIRSATAISGPKPTKRVNKRITQPPGGTAKPKHLEAGGLTLFETMPRRYWRGEPSGGEIKESGPDSLGRRPFGGAFHVKLKSGATGKMRKLTPKIWSRSRPAKNPKSNYLPIGWAEYVDLTPSAYRLRRSVLRDLARWWPSQMANRWRKEFRKVFRRA